MSSLNKLLSITLGATATIALCGAKPVQGQEAWPARPIQMVVPSSAGSGTDALARAMAQRLSESLKQPVIVENRPGGSGVIGTNAVLKAAPDGYTLLYTTASSMVVAPAVIKSISQDARKGLVPIAQTAAGGVLLLVSPDFPAHDLAGLIQLVKANPDKYSYGSWATGSSGHLTMEWLKKQTGMKTEHAAYRTSTQLLTELSAGVLKIGWTDPSVAVPFLRAGKVRGIAIVGNVRSPQLPEVKTLAEQGYKFNTVGWFGMFAPAGTNPAIVKRLNEEVNKAQGSPDIAALMKRLNFEPPPVTSSAQLGEIVRNDMQVWTKIANDAGIKVDE